MSESLFCCFCENGGVAKKIKKNKKKRKTSIVAQKLLIDSRHIVKIRFLQLLRREAIVIADVHIVFSSKKNLRIIIVGVRYNSKNHKIKL